MPGVDAIDIYRGADIVLPFQMTPVADVTDWTILMTVGGGAAPVIEKDGIVTDGPAGQFQFHLLAEDSEEVDAGHYRYDVWRTNEGSKGLLAIGTFNVRERVRAAEET